MQAAGAAGFAQTRPAQNSGMLKPRALKAGDSVALITPSTETNEPETLRVAEETCAFFGLKPVRMPNVGKRQVNFAESVKNRLADFHAAFTGDYAGVFCVRGGYGAQQILDGIDYALVRRNPKVFLGYSDITALHLAIQKKCGLVTFHGPVPVSSFTGYTREHFQKALFRTEPLGELTNPVERDALRPNHRLRTLRPGTARGRLAGGNLSLIVATMGTPYEIETQGRILLLEDVGEQIYSLDRMLMNLRLAKKLQQAAGIVWGEPSDCPPKGVPASQASPWGLTETVENLLGDLGVPVLSGLTIGHTADQLTLPLGLMARLDADRGVLGIEESAFADG
jgi:muramoyltetrapeptide carboxypeptidase